MRKILVVIFTIIATVVLISIVGFSIGVTLDLVERMNALGAQMLVSLVITTLSTLGVYWGCFFIFTKAQEYYDKN